MLIKKVLIVAIDTFNMYKERPYYEYKGLSHVNWWEVDLNKTWFADYLATLYGGKVKHIRMYSIFGPKYKLKDDFNGIKVFFCTENLLPRKKHARLYERKEKIIPWETVFRGYKEKINRYNMDLVLGFDTEGINNAIRFPYWIIAHFKECFTLKDVRKRLCEIEDSFNNTDVSRKGAAVIASHDFLGTRADICDCLSHSIEIAYPGKWRNNTQALWEEYGNNKINFLAKYRFNICPENMDAKGYVTEKIWDSFAAGCIPIYGGALGNPEPNIFNRNAFILWDFDGDNEQNIAEIMRINEDDNYYQQKKREKVFIEGADRYIFSIINDFRFRIDQLIKAYP